MFTIVLVWKEISFITRYQPIFQSGASHKYSCRQLFHPHNRIVAPGADQQLWQTEVHRQVSNGIQEVHVCRLMVANTKTVARISIPWCSFVHFYCILFSPPPLLPFLLPPTFHLPSHFPPTFPPSPPLSPLQPALQSSTTVQATDAKATVS